MNAASSRQALDGIRAIELTAGMAGPWIGRHLAWCGADVIKIESRTRPDVTRLYVPPRQPQMGPQEQVSPWLTDWNGGKRFVALDLRTPGGIELAKRLVAASDVVIDNFRTGALDKLGIGYEGLRRVRPDLVYLSTTGFGDTGPCRDYVTWGPNIEALSGIARQSGFPGRECTMTQFAYPDALSALHGLFAVMCALDHRERTGEGQYINLSQLETSVSVIGDVLLEMLANGREPEPRGNTAPDAAPHGCYPCRGEDRWCAIAVFTDEEWRALCCAIDAPDLAADAGLATLDGRRTRAGEIDRRIAAWTRARDDQEVMHALQRAGIAAGAVHTIEDQVRHDPQIAARGFLETIPHAKLGQVTATGIPLGLTGTPGRTPHTGGAIGAHNDEVFRDVLGLDDDEIARFVASGAIETAAPDTMTGDPCRSR